MRLPWTPIPFSLEKVLKKISSPPMHNGLPKPDVVLMMAHPIFVSTVFMNVLKPVSSLMNSPFRPFPGQISKTLASSQAVLTGRHS
jgi:hypothetical protein